MKVWLAHGVLAFLAWGVLLPFSVNASLLRNKFPKGPLWFNFHRNTSFGAFALFVALFCIAVSYTTKEGRRHFNNSHGDMGLAMFILTTLQMLRGIFRPRFTSSGEADRGTFLGSDKEKTKWRLVWEGGHRLLGTVLLSCGFSAMGSGIKLFSNKYSVNPSNEEKLLMAYWAWLAAMTATTSFVLWYSKIRKAKSDDPTCESCSDVDTDSGAAMPQDTTIDIEVDDNHRFT